MTTLSRRIPHLFSRFHLPRRRNSPSLDWQVLEEHDERAWRSATTRLRATSTSTTRRRAATPWWLLVPVFLVLLMGAVWLHNRALQADSQLQRELELAVEAEAWRAASSSRQASPEVVRILDLHENQAVVSVATTSTVTGAPDVTTLQTQVYVWSPRGWTRTSPSIVTWGESRRLESSHFIFEYFARDHDAVVAAAAQLDHLYPDLVAAYPSARPRQKLTIVVSPTTAPRTSFQRYNLTGRLVTASPASYLAPDSLTPPNLIVQAVVLDLINDRALQVLHDTLMSRHQTILVEAEPPEWNALVFATQVWQILDLDSSLPLAAWRVPLIHWMLEYGIEPRGGEVPEFVAAFCRDAAVWRMVPLTVDIPVACGPPTTTNTQDQEWTNTQWARNGVSPLHLSYLQPYRLVRSNIVEELQTPHPDIVVGPGYAPHPVTVIALATLVDYTAHTYGLTAVADLLAQAPNHHGWDTLTPAVLGISTAEFEAGWHEFLAQEYDVHVVPEFEVN